MSVDPVEVMARAMWQAFPQEWPWEFADETAKAITRVQAQAALSALLSAGWEVKQQQESMVAGRAGPERAAGSEPSWTPKQVEALHWFQHSRRMHPFTCPDRGDGNHFVNGHDKGMLVPTERGWICQSCDYTQDWAHDHMFRSQPDVERIRAELRSQAKGSAGADVGSGRAAVGAVPAPSLPTVPSGTDTSRETEQ